MYFQKTSISLSRTVCYSLRTHNRSNSWTGNNTTERYIASPQRNRLHNWSPFFLIFKSPDGRQIPNIIVLSNYFMLTCVTNSSFFFFCTLHGECVGSLIPLENWYREDVRDRSNRVKQHTPLNYFKTLSIELVQGSNL